MNPRELVRYSSVRAALVAFAAASAVALWALTRAIRVDAVPELPPPVLASAGSIGGLPVKAVADIRDAVENDPFSPDRTAGSPYRMPGDPDPKSAEPVVEPMKPTLIGTALSADGVSFAVLQMGDARTVSVHVGEKIGDYTLKTIERTRVVLASPTGKRVEVSAIKPEP